MKRLPPHPGFKTETGPCRRLQPSWKCIAAAEKAGLKRSRATAAHGETTARISTPYTTI